MEQEEKSREELLQLLRELRQGKLSSQAIYEALNDFGRVGFLEARADVEQLLSHPDQEVRYMALEVLTLDWHIHEHWKTALDVLEHDPDDENRIRAAGILSALKKNTQDRQVLQTLARTIRNENNDMQLRKVAYYAMESVLHDPGPRARLERHRQPFDPVKDIDWNLVNSYL